LDIHHYNYGLFEKRHCNFQLLKNATTILYTFHKHHFAIFNTKLRNIHLYFRCTYIDTVVPMRVSLCCRFIFCVIIISLIYDTSFLIKQYTRCVFMPFENKIAAPIKFSLCLLIFSNEWSDVVLIHHILFSW
jgi:hypothetical protein